MARVGSTHHVLGIPHLLCELGDCEGTVLLGATGCQWGEADHEEVETGEGDQVHCQLPEIGIKLTREPKAAGDPTHGGRDQMVQIPNCKN